MKLRWTIGLLLLLTACGQSLSLHPPELSDAAFVRLSEELSERPGYFDTDNLISNESSYQHVIPSLRRLTRPGGAYLGVGPDQNFTYIANTRPSLALIVDVRRDNLLQHLYLKELFRRSENRWEYLGLMLGRPPPEDFRPPAGDAAVLCDTVRRWKPDRDFAVATFEDVWKSLLRTFPGLVSRDDRGTLLRIAWPFFEEGLDLKFRSFGRPPRSSYPTFEELLIAEDLDGVQNSYLASDTAYGFVRRLQLENRIVPVVGDLAGPSALRKIGRYLAEHGYTVSGFYTSNVEFYLFNSQTFERFVDNLRSLPVDDRSVLIRSYFSYWRHPHPETVPGFPVTSLLQSLPVFLDRQARNPDRDYLDLIFSDFVPIASVR